MIKKPLRLLLLVSALLFQHQIDAQIKRSSGFIKKPDKELRKELRQRLRAPYGATPYSSESSNPDSDWGHSPIKIKGGSLEFKIQINKALNLIKEKTPLLYKVAQHRVDTIHWAPKSGSYARPNHHNKGGIWIGDREWNHPQRYGVVFIALIHEIQHCNTFGDSNEGAARWAGFYYGQKLNINPFYCSWSKAIALQINYKPEWWDDNLLNTQLNYKAQPKHDFNTAKYSKDHAGLAAKQGRK